MNNTTAPHDHSLTNLNLDVMKNFPIPYVEDKQLEANVNTPNVVVRKRFGEKNL